MKTVQQPLFVRSGNNKSIDKFLEAVNYSRWVLSKIVSTNAHSRWFFIRLPNNVLCHGNCRLYNRDLVCVTTTAARKQARVRVVCVCVMNASEVFFFYTWAWVIIKQSAAVFLTLRTYLWRRVEFLRLCTNLDLMGRLFMINKILFYFSLAEYASVYLLCKGLWNLNANDHWDIFFLNAHVQRSYEYVGICMQDIPQTHIPSQQINVTSTPLSLNLTYLGSLTFLNLADSSLVQRIHLARTKSSLPSQQAVPSSSLTLTQRRIRSNQSVYIAKSLKHFIVRFFFLVFE